MYINLQNYFFNAPHRVAFLLETCTDLWSMED